MTLRFPLTTNGAAVERFNFPGLIQVSQAISDGPVRKLPHSNTELKRQIRELQRAEEKLLKAQADLAHLSRVSTMGQLAASLAHEINQPITSILSNANASLRWLARESPDIGEARVAIQRILRDANRMADIIARIRTLLQRRDTSRELFDFTAAIEEIIVLTAGQMQQTGVTFNAQLEHTPLVRGDKVQLQQVVLNLLVNASEAMTAVPANSRTLHLIARCVPTDDNDLQSCPDQEWIQSASAYLLVTVADSGPGLSFKSRRYLFQPFYTTKSHGLGMGLAISRSIVEAHDGRLWAQDNEPQGALFRFALSLPSETSGNHSRR
jgi:C4-dicarboxylate-specific signal transduction histidine kinase